jgi:disulfide bond formation protein DsbB
MKDLYIFVFTITLLHYFQNILHRIQPCYMCLTDIIRFFSRPQGLTLKGSKLKLKILTS